MAVGRESFLLPSAQVHNRMTLSPAHTHNRVAILRLPFFISARDNRLTRPRIQLNHMVFRPCCTDLPLRPSTETGVLSVEIHSARVSCYVCHATISFLPASFLLFNFHFCLARFYTFEFIFALPGFLLLTLLTCGV